MSDNPIICAEEEPIICPLEIDTFLATSEIGLYGSEKREMTTEERREIGASLEAILEESYPEGFWGCDEDKELKKTLTCSSSQQLN